MKKTVLSLLLCLLLIGLVPASMLAVSDYMTVDMSISGTAVPGGTVDIRLTHTPQLVVWPLENIAYTLDLNAGLTGLAATGLPRNDVLHAGSLLSGTSLVILTGGRVDPGSAATYSFTVQIPAGCAPGDYPLTTSSITFTSMGTPMAIGPASTTLRVVSPYTAPSGLNAVSTGQDRIQLSWTHPEDLGQTPTGYRIYVSESLPVDTAGTCALQTGADVTSAVLDSLSPGTTYHLAVTALYGSDTSDASDPASVTTDAAGPISVQLNAGDPADSGVTDGTLTYLLGSDTPTTYTAPVRPGHLLDGLYEDDTYALLVLNADGSPAADDVDGWISGGVWANGSNGSLALTARWSDTDSGDNDIQLSSANAVAGQNITFMAIGAGMDNSSPDAGDYRCLPSSWQINPSGTFPAGGPYEAKLPTADMAAGEHDLIITFLWQKYDGETWVNTGDTVQASTPITLVDEDIPATGAVESTPAAGVLLGLAAAGLAMRTILRRREQNG